MLKALENLLGHLYDAELISDCAQMSLDSGGHQGRDLCNAMTRAGLVLLCGSFEGFLRDLIRDFIKSILDERVKSCYLPDDLVCEYFQYTAEKMKPQNVVGFKRVVRDEDPTPLDIKYFSNTGGNPTVDMIESMFGRIGIPDVIDILSVRDFKVDSTFILESQIDKTLRAKITTCLQTLHDGLSSQHVDGIVSVLDEKWQPRKKRRKVGYVGKIEELLKNRNLIAHGDHAPQITPLELNGYITSIENLALGLHNEVEELMERIFLTATGEA